MVMLLLRSQIFKQLTTETMFIKPLFFALFTCMSMRTPLSCNYFNNISVRADNNSRVYIGSGLDIFGIWLDYIERIIARKPLFLPSIAFYSASFCVAQHIVQHPRVQRFYRTTGLDKFIEQTAAGALIGGTLGFCLTRLLLDPLKRHNALHASSGGLALSGYLIYCYFKGREMWNERYRMQKNPPKKK